MAFALQYHQHGGSGLSLALTEVEDMEIPRILWWYEKLVEVRNDEAAALQSG